MEEAFSLPDRWSELVNEAKKKDRKLLEKKLEFAEVTKAEVAEFKENIKVLFKSYKANGPGSSDISLD